MSNNATTSGYFFESFYCNLGRGSERAGPPLGMGIFRFAPAVARGAFAALGIMLILLDSAGAMDILLVETPLPC